MNESTEEAVKPETTVAVVSELMMPHQVNNLGHVFGGELLSMVDRAAAVVSVAARSYERSGIARVVYPCTRCVPTSTTQRTRRRPRTACSASRYGFSKVKSSAAKRPRAARKPRPAKAGRQGKGQ